ncbi:hypothetical protein IF2G_07636 [Cordyceps javanica]|nr:hypothetical protein IF2G_07636 [Cordyceps javanica]
MKSCPQPPGAPWLYDKSQFGNVDAALVRRGGRKGEQARPKCRLAPRSSLAFP